MLDRVFQTNWFVESGPKIAEMHRNNLTVRKMTLEAVSRVARETINSVSWPGNGLVLEVGCGDNFFRDWLTPDWLKPRLVGFDINFPSLFAAKNRDKQANVFLADANDLRCIPEDSCSGAIGWSSFDSLPDLEKVLHQIERVLKPEAPLLLFQDATVELYTPLLRESDRHSTEYYHKVLEIACFKNKGLAVEFSGNIEQIAIVSRKDLTQSAADKYFLRIAERALVVGNNLGRLIGCEERENLEKFVTHYGIRENLAELVAPDKVVQWARLKVVKAKKLV